MPDLQGLRGLLEGGRRHRLRRRIRAGRPHRQARARCRCVRRVVVRREGRARQRPRYRRRSRSTAERRENGPGTRGPGAALSGRLREAAEVELDHLGIVEQLGTGSGVRVPALIEHVAAVGELQAAARVLLHDQHRDSVGVDAGDAVEHVVLHHRRQSRRRLVEQQDRRFASSTRVRSRASGARRPTTNRLAAVRAHPVEAANQ